MVAKHAWVEGHVIAWDETEILEKEEKERKREVTHILDTTRVIAIQRYDWNYHH